MERVCAWLLPFMLTAGSAYPAAVPDCRPARNHRRPYRSCRAQQRCAAAARRTRRSHGGIRIPHANNDRAPSFIADQAYDALNAMARGHTVDVTAVAPKEDRYDRVRGQVFNGGDRWLQLALLKNGLSRVDISPDRTECAAELYAAEGSARAASIGLWSEAVYGVRTPDALGGDTGTFQIVQGRVLTADVKSGRAYLDFGADWKTDFTVTVAPEDMANFRRDGIDPRDYAGKTIRVRGIVQQFNGPEIEIANPKQIEIVQ
jgi:hypothetical protein